jgi:hypothetical protein
MTVVVYFGYGFISLTQPAFLITVACFGEWPQNTARPITADARNSTARSFVAHKTKEHSMAQNSGTHQRGGGLRGHDKQQGDLTDQADGQGIVRDQRGQDQPNDKDRAQRTPGQKAQQDAAQTQPQSPGQPARGE